MIFLSHNHDNSFNKKAILRDIASFPQNIPLHSNKNDVTLSFFCQKGLFTLLDRITPFTF